LITTVSLNELEDASISTLLIEVNHISHGVAFT